MAARRRSGVASLTLLIAFVAAAVESDLGAARHLHLTGTDVTTPGPDVRRMIGPVCAVVGVEFARSGRLAPGGLSQRTEVEANGSNVSSASSASSSNVAAAAPDLANGRGVTQPRVHLHPHSFDPLAGADGDHTDEGAGDP